jgi:hypothetical protein
MRQNAAPIAEASRPQRPARTAALPSEMHFRVQKMGKLQYCINKL